MTICVIKIGFPLLYVRNEIKFTRIKWIKQIYTDFRLFGF